MPTMKEIIATLESDIEAERLKLRKYESEIPAIRERIKKASKLLGNLRAVYEPAQPADVDIRGDNGEHLCPDCGQVFLLYQDLADHRRKHLVPPAPEPAPKTQAEGGYPCKVCGQVFPTFQGLGGHMYGHKNRGEWPGRDG